MNEETVEAGIASNQETALAVLPAQAGPPTPEPENIIVVASNPQQMQAAQQDLIKHFTAKKEGLKAQLTEAQNNLAIAKERKWKVGPWQSQVKKYEKEMQFYDKVVAALEAGYVIIPNYPDLDIFAIKTKKFKPKTNVTRGGPTWVDRPERQVSESPPLGEGRYVNADTINTEWADKKKLTDGSIQENRMSKAIAFDDVDFPFKFAKPQILDGTAKAMKVLCFDSIGILPRRNIRRGDPMVIGEIYKGNKAVSFLITWFVDTSVI